MYISIKPYFCTYALKSNLKPDERSVLSEFYGCSVGGIFVARRLSESVYLRCCVLNDNVT